jgi:hypothetical protein
MMIDKGELSVMVMAQRAADRGERIAMLEARIGEYQTALIEISELPGVRADEASDIARRALFKHTSFKPGNKS